MFSGSTGGITDLYLVNADGTSLRRLTNDKFGDLQPQWSPDGKTIAFASDRDSASFAILYFKPWRITLLDLATGTTSVLPGQGGLNLNPQWAPDGRSIAYVSDRTGTANIFLYDLGRARALPAHERRRRGLGAHGVQSGDQLGATGRSPGVHVLRERSIHDLDGEQSARAAKGAVSASPRRSRSCVAAAPSDTINRSVSIVALLDSFDLGLPDTTKFRVNRYRVRLQPDYVTRPSIGYVARRVRAQRVRRNDRGAQRHARQQPPRDLGRGQRAG